MYTPVTAQCIDQTLRITNIPKLASGGENEIRVDVSFDAMWDDLGKTAIFYRTEAQVYHVVMKNDSCVIPREVLVEPGHLHFGIIGVGGATVKTTEVVVLNVAQGAITGLSPLEPLPDVYKQVLAAYGTVANDLAVERARITNLSTLAEGSTTGDAELADIRVGKDGVRYNNAGDAVREQYERNRAYTARQEKRFDAGENKLNSEAVLAGHYYTCNTGARVDAANTYTSEYITCQANEDWTVYGIVHITIWDSHFKYLRGFVCSVANNYLLTFNTGDQAAYIVVGIVGLTPELTTLGKGTERVPHMRYTPTVKYSALDEKQFDRKRFIEAMQEYHYPVAGVEWRLGGMDSTGADAPTTFSSITDYFTVPAWVGKFVVACETKPVWVVGYDTDFNVVHREADWGNHFEVANDCAYYRVTQQHGEECGRVWEDDVQIYFDVKTTHPGNGKRPYQAGFIPFTVPVNQQVAGEAAPDTEMTVDVDCVLRLPEDYTEAGEPSKLLMVCHGAGRGVTGDGNWCGQESYLALIEKFVNAGYAVFDCNGYSNDALGWNHWGCSRGLEAYRKAYDYVTKHYNVSPVLSVYGFSMGGLTAFNLIHQHFPGVKCLALGSPVLNLKEMCWDSGVNSAFVAAYGMGTTTYDATKTVGHDPIKSIVNVEGTPLVTRGLPPVKIWFGSTEDGSAGGVNRQNAINLVAAIRNANGVAFYREVNDAGHEICYGANNTVNDEIVYWLNRHNF